ncbi:MAG: PAS domain S-box protein [Anaerolineales bacterium]
MPYPLRLALLYVLFGGLWILVSDRLAAWLFPNPQLLLQVNTFKGWFFIAVTASLFYLELRREYRRIDHTTTALQESERTYQMLAQISPVGIFRTDLNGSTTYVNPQWCQISGLSADQALGDGWLAAVHPDDKEKISRGWRESALRHQPSFSDYRFIRPDGTIAWVMGQALPEMNPENQVIGYVGTITDITDRKRAEAALQASESQLSLIYANISDILFYLDVEEGERFRFISVNPAFLGATGLSEEQVVGKLVEEVIPEPSRSLVLGNYKKAIQTKKAVTWEEITEYPAGRKYGQVSAIPIFEAGGTCFHLIGTVHDITESKQAEARILHINRLYATLSQLNQAIVDASDRETLLRETCRVAVDYGQFRLAWVGLIDPTAHLVAPVVFAGDEQGYLSNLKVAYQDEELGRGPTGTAIREDRCVLCQDIATDPGMGPWRTAALQRGLRSSAAVPIQQTGQIIGALTVYAGEPHLFDAEEEALLVKIGQAISFALDGLIHEAQRKQAEAELKQLNSELELRVLERTAQLESANKELESFSYSVSHDLRAPLRAISGFSEIIARRHRASLNEEGQHYIDNIVQASGRMGHLIDDLLTYARLGRAGARHEPVSLASLVSEISRNMQAHLDQIHGTLTIAEGLPTVTGDQTLLSQVFTNLLENAIKYHKPGLPPQVSLTYYNQDKYVVFKVSDNGIGIPPEYQEKIFIMFQRLHSEEEYPGTGVGLATVRKSVTLLRGSVWVESKVGEGSTFFVRLPKENGTNG